jgi:hypothetical protein
MPSFAASGLYLNSGKVLIDRLLFPVGLSIHTGKRDSQNKRKAGKFCFIKASTIFML